VATAHPPRLRRCQARRPDLDRPRRHWCFSRPRARHAARGLRHLRVPLEDRALGAGLLPGLLRGRPAARGHHPPLAPLGRASLTGLGPSAVPCPGGVLTRSPRERHEALTARACQAAVRVDGVPVAFVNVPVAFLRCFAGSGSGAPPCITAHPPIATTLQTVMRSLRTPAVRHLACHPPSVPSAPLAAWRLRDARPDGRDRLARDPAALPGRGPGPAPPCGRVVVTHRVAALSAYRSQPAPDRRLDARAGPAARGRTRSGAASRSRRASSSHSAWPRRGQDSRGGHARVAQPAKRRAEKACSHQDLPAPPPHVRNRSRGLRVCPGGPSAGF
jgi:hypothetical protein